MNSIFSIDYENYFLKLKQKTIIGIYDCKM